MVRFLPSYLRNVAMDVFKARVLSQILHQSSRFYIFFTLKIPSSFPRLRSSAPRDHRSPVSSKFIIAIVQKTIQSIHQSLFTLCPISTLLYQRLIISVDLVFLFRPNQTSSPNPNVCHGSLFPRGAYAGSTNSSSRRTWKQIDGQDISLSGLKYMSKRGSIRGYIRLRMCTSSSKIYFTCKRPVINTNDRNT